MRVWAVGVAAIRAQATAFATTLGAGLVDTTTADAIPESVWTEQIHEDGVRRQARLTEPVIAVLYLPGDYDAENTVVMLKHRLPPGSRIIAVVDPGVSAETLDGFTHEAVVPVRVVTLGELLS